MLGYGVEPGCGDQDPPQGPGFESLPRAFRGGKADYGPARSALCGFVYGTVELPGGVKVPVLEYIQGQVFPKFIRVSLYQTIEDF